MGPRCLGLLLHFVGHERCIVTCIQCNTNKFQPGTPKTYAINVLTIITTTTIATSLVIMGPTLVLPWGRLEEDVRERLEET